MKENFKCSYSEIVPVHKLIENPKNNNHHPARQVELLAKAIDFQGQRRAIVVSKRSGFITKGHCCLQAVKLLGWENVAVDYQDYESEAQEYADLTADNKLARYGEIDEEAILKELQELDIEAELLGFDEFKALEEAEVEMPELPSGKKEPFQQMTFTFSDEQAEAIKEAIEKIKNTDDFKNMDTSENKNSNGNALYLLVLKGLNG